MRRVFRGDSSAWRGLHHSTVATSGSGLRNRVGTLLILVAQSLFLQGWKPSPRAGILEVRDTVCRYPHAAGRSACNAGAGGIDTDVATRRKISITGRCFGVKGERNQWIEADSGSAVLPGRLMEDRGSRNENLALVSGLTPGGAA